MKEHWRVDWMSTTIERGDKASKNQRGMDVEVGIDDAMPNSMEALALFGMGCPPELQPIWMKHHVNRASTAGKIHHAGLMCW